jgi:hypothetical protein
MSFRQKESLDLNSHRAQTENTPRERTYITKPEEVPLLYMIIFIVALAVIGPFFGADSRDGLDWRPGHFWRRLPAQTPAVKMVVRTTGSPAPASSAPSVADPRRPAAAGC